jgi:hypothetical protein
VRSLILFLLISATALAQPSGGSGPGPSSTFVPSNGTAPTTPAAFAANSISVTYVQGIDTTGTSDSSVGFQNALNIAGATCGTVTVPYSAKIRILSSISVPSCTTIQGAIGNLGDPAGNSGAQTYNQLGGIRLSQSATITLNSMSGAKDLLVLADGLTFPVSSGAGYAGTAFTVPNMVTDPFLKNVMILGFNQAFGTQGQSDRVTLENVYADGVGGTSTNCAKGVICLTSSYDSAHLSHVRLWPYGSYGAVSDTITRTGTGFYFSGHSDLTEADELFDLGHNTAGVDIEAMGEIQIGRLVTDTNSGVGVILNNVSQVQIAQLQQYTFGTGLQANNSQADIGDLMQRNVAGSTICVQVDNTGMASKLWIGTANLYGCQSSTPVSVGQAADAIRIGRLYLSQTAIPSVVLPSGSTDKTFRVSQISTDGLFAAGSGLINLNIGFQTIVSASTIALDTDTDNYEVTGTAAIATINGQYGGRKLLLKFDGNASLSNSGNIVLANAYSNSQTMSAGATATLVYDNSSSKWIVTAFSSSLSAQDMGTTYIYADSTIGAQNVVNGLTNTNYQAWFGVNTSSGHGVAQAYNSGSGATLDIQPYGGGLTIGGTAAVSCAANTVSLATFTVTNGIVTHC